MDIRSVSGPGNVDPYKSGDPGLQAALAAATTIEQDFPLACERALGKLLVNEINSLIGQGGTLKDFQGWLSNNDLLFQGPSYFGVTETDVLYIYDKVAQKSTAPTFTPMDDLMDQFATWLNTDSVVANTPNFQLAITMGFYPPTTPALFAQYCTQIADEGGSPFANFGDLIDHPDEIYKFASLSGAPMELTWVKAMAQAQVANTTGDDKAFFQSIVTELNKCSTLADFQAWVKTTYGVQDAYMQNPGVDASLIEQFYFLAGTPTAATTLDTDFSKLYAALSGTSYKDALLAQISALGSNGTEAQFAALFSKYDLYWQYPSLSGDDVAKIDACFHQTPAGITDMDTALREAIAWKDQASGEAQQLATDLYNEILHDCNSQTPMKGGALSAWLTQNFGTYDIYWNYPGLTETDAQNFFSICKIDPVSETPMDKAYFAAQTWLQGHSNTDPAYAFIQNLLSQITSEGSFQDPTAFLAQFTLTHDIYWQNTTFTEQDGLDIYAICQAKTPPAFTDMDNALREVLAWLATPNLSDPAKQLAATLYMEISSNCNSQTPMKGGTLSDWIAQKFSTDDIYWTYPGLTEDEASNFFSICRIGTVKDNDIDQVHAFLVSWTPGTSAGAQLRSDLIAYIDGLNSGTSPQTFTDFVTKMFVKCDASWLYPGISSDDITALNAGCKLSLGEETDMDKAYFAVQAWLTANPAAGPMRDFVAQFFTQIKAAGSYPSVTTTLLAPYSSPPNNDMFWLEPQLT